MLLAARRKDISSVYQSSFHLGHSCESALLNCFLNTSSKGLCSLHYKYMYMNTDDTQIYQNCLAALGNIQHELNTIFHSYTQLSLHINSETSAVVGSNTHTYNYFRLIS